MIKYFFYFLFLPFEKKPSKRLINLSIPRLFYIPKIIIFNSTLGDFYFILFFYFYTKLITNS
ncbi:hypothetical protein CROQUDRAFT_580363 [Cronartium quercuum f. sp. fusiforme G11]|uniref:Uncharacterized protein n=1 Tax=Cronartium quercuum f. sp. fusiforme G11 TaxID=708437 RepID=A0A9P6TC50_9BASI|nr:hypothetical protein CROQUDRAFT_580363 [Cronartium quercuum f. sp. fusiforme G11]